MSNTTLTQNQLLEYLNQVELPAPHSHKGENGKLLIIGGSKLFHAASTWSLDTASRFVDMVFYSSIPENNKTIKQAKKKFWNGIVLPRQSTEKYLQEADCVLIGPGMQRSSKKTSTAEHYSEPTPEEWNHATDKIINYLLQKYPNKKWVIDAGALQMMDPELLTKTCLITPHEKELLRVLKKLNKQELIKKQAWQEISQALNQAVILLKGPVDKIITPTQTIKVEGGNAGMTKGGTGDVLAGLAAGLYTNSPLLPSSVAASYVNKAAGDFLYQRVGPFFNATDLMEAIPGVLWNLLKVSSKQQPLSPV